MPSPSDDIIDLYRRHAKAWVEARGSELKIERLWLDRFCTLLPNDARILDIGCGSGEPIARHLVDRGYAVTGIDSAADMIEMFRRNLPEQEAHIADMRALALLRRFDGVLAWDSFFHLDYDDQRAMFAVFAHHAKAGAPLMFTSGPAHGQAIGTFAGEPLHHASLDPAEYKSLLDTNGLFVLGHVCYDV
jgi:2-polyprenyl-3-methyl-5-hydroxy-6-metoxy-1,4-benzoquinol methylase